MGCSDLVLILRKSDGIGGSATLPENKIRTKSEPSQNQIRTTKTCSTCHQVSVTIQCVMHPLPPCSVRFGSIRFVSFRFLSFQSERIMSKPFFRGRTILTQALGVTQGLPDNWCHTGSPRRLVSRRVSNVRSCGRNSRAGTPPTPT